MVAVMAAATERIRALLEGQRESSLAVLARLYPLPLDAVGALVQATGLDRMSPRALLHLNPGLPWAELLEGRGAAFVVDWVQLSALEGGHWDAALLARWADRWDWKALSANPSLPWSVALIARFAERWDWTVLSGNRGIPFDGLLIAAFDERWVVSRLAANTAVPWDRALVERLAARLGEPDPAWNAWLEHEPPQSVAPGITLGDSGWRHLMQNPGVAWAEVLPVLPAPDWGLLSANPGLEWTDALLDRHASELVLGGLRHNPSVPWTEALAAQLVEDPRGRGGADRRLERIWSKARVDGNPRGAWHLLSGCPDAPWTAERVARHADRWHWPALSANPGVPWTVALLTRFADRVRWDALAAKGSLTGEVLGHFADRLDWDRAVSCNRAIPWTAELIAAHAERFNWERLSWHPGLPWSDALLVRFADRWVVRSFARNPAAWAAVRPHLDSAWVRDLLRAEGLGAG